MLNFNEFLENEDILTEGIHDKGIFKAFYLAGGPGSGKSWVAAKTLEGSGMKVVNSDIGFENYAKRAGLDLKQMGDFTKDQTKLKDELRRRAKRGTETMGQHAVNGRLGLIIDSTARDADKIESAASGLRYLGYDTYMIFVNTTLEVALERNGKRERKIAPSVVENNWKGVQANLGKFQRLFGMRNMMIVDNSKYNDNETNAVVYKSIRKLLTRPPSTWQAKAWIKKELAQELYKRVFLPFYILLISIVVSFLILNPHVSATYKLGKIKIFLTGILIVVLSEISINLISDNNLKNLIILMSLPTFILFSYLIFINKVKVSS